jgi:hypothetical protein
MAVAMPLLGVVSAEAEARPAVRATAIAAPVLDGDVLNDDAWQKVEPATGFVQTRPYSGKPASEKTEVRVGFDEHFLYIGVVLFDREPDRIIVSDSRRDASLDETDSFTLIIDTFGDEQNGFVFGTNPAGIEYDGQVVKGGSGGFGSLRFNRGTSTGFNLNWDGAWQVAASQGSYGWSAEFAIPFRTLRYPSGSPQTWGINFQRNIRRHNERSFWSELDQNMSIDRLTEAGTLVAVEPPPQRNLKLIPYVLGSAERLGNGPDDTETDADAGIDLKYSLTPSLTLDLTYNTDFAQVEVDEQQVNLDRFNLFFPEKRPFFLENAGVFAVGASGEVDLFFSRRIGLGESGEVIPIDYGARLSGKVGRFNLGILNMQTDDFGAMSGNNYGVARVSREFRNRSSVGGIFINREGTGSRANQDDENQSYALDGQWGIGEYHTLEAFVAQTDTPGLDSDDHAYRVMYNHSSPKWRGFLGYLEAAENFNPEVGFLARKGFRSPRGFVMRTIRPEKLWGLHELRPHVSHTVHYDFDGFKETSFTHVDNHWEWRNGYEIHTGINFTEEGVKEPFEISPGVVVRPGSYKNEEASLVFMTNRGAPLSFSSNAKIGGFFGGDRTSLDNTLVGRLGEKLTSELVWSYNNVNLPEGDFDVNLGRLRVSYSVTPRMLVQALMQYNDRTDTVSTNLRFSWLQDANTGLFVVYNEIDEFGMREFFERPERRVIIKYSYLFDVLRR